MVRWQKHQPNNSNCPYDYDSALISIDEPMTILRAENREAVEIALADLPTTNVHANIILGATVGEGTVEIKLSISYHVGPAVQQALKDKLIAAGLGAHVTYEGILNWFNETVLGIMSADDHYLRCPKSTKLKLKEFSDSFFLEKICNIR